MPEGGIEAPSVLVGGRESGARGRNLVEQTVIVKEFTARWFRPEIDFCELAKLRKDGWKVKDIAAHMGISKTCVLDRLRKLDSRSQI